MSEGVDSCAATSIQQGCQGSEEEEKAGISFNPPVYRQRYMVVHQMINKYNAKKVLDFGCAEAKLLRYLIRNEIVMEHLVGVDIDEELLKENTFRIQPLLCDYLGIRETPFTVSILQGSISQADDRFCAFDLISCVEIIEHLIPEHLEQMPAVLFGQLSPKVVMVTTPNAEFNVLFPNLEGFRHWDHKFEWTRKEFQEWSTTQANKYGYMVTFEGIGSGPIGTEHLGCCSQMALFVKNETCEVPCIERQSFGQPYKLITQVEYPYRKSTTTQAQKIIYEVERLLWFLAQPTGYEEETVDGYDDDDEEDDDDKHKPYELTKLFSMGRLQELCETIDDLRSVLQESTLKLTSDSNAVLYSPPQWQTSDSEDSNDWNDINEHSVIDDNDNTTTEEDWDLEVSDQNSDICWNKEDGGSSSIYWSGCAHTDSIQTEDSDHYSDSETDSCAITSTWFEVEDNDDDLDCTTGDDGLPWITTNTVEQT